MIATWKLACHFCADDVNAIRRALAPTVDAGAYEAANAEATSARVPEHVKKDRSSDIARAFHHQVRWASLLPLLALWKKEKQTTLQQPMAPNDYRLNLHLHTVQFYAGVLTRISEQPKQPKQPVVLAPWKPLAAAWERERSRLVSQESGCEFPTTRSRTLAWIQAVTGWFADRGLGKFMVLDFFTRGWERLEHIGRRGGRDWIDYTEDRADPVASVSIDTPLTFVNLLTAGLGLPAWLALLPDAVRSPWSPQTFATLQSIYDGKAFCRLTRARYLEARVAAGLPVEIRGEVAAGSRYPWQDAIRTTDVWVEGRQILRVWPAEAAVVAQVAKGDQRLSWMLYELAIYDMAKAATQAMLEARPIAFVRADGQHVSERAVALLNLKRPADEEKKPQQQQQQKQQKQKQKPDVARGMEELLTMPVDDGRFMVKFKALVEHLGPEHVHMLSQRLRQEMSSIKLP